MNKIFLNYYQPQKFILFHLFIIGKPNLIVCEPRDQIKVAMSLYAYTPSAPMPSNDELLYCTSSTTGEEVENFLHLVVAPSLYRHNSPLYCIMNMQDLGYSAQTKLDDFIHSEHFKASANAKKFVLVFLLSTNVNEKPTLIESILSKNRVLPTLLDDAILLEYLSNKLHTNTRKCLDPDNKTVRVLTSARSGNGKSKYIKNLMKNSKDVSYKVVRIKSKTVDLNAEIEKLMEYRMKNDGSGAKLTVFHLDVAYEV
jgi:hypothetical protein